jgi:aspartyl-tRNA synthetase
MSFATGEDVRRLVDYLVVQLCRDLLGIELRGSDIPRITYEDAMGKYGSDKPNRLLGMEVKTFEQKFGEAKLFCSL